MDSGLVEKIIDGSIAVDDMETYQKLTRENPDNIELTALYADFLCNRGLLDLAYANYETALDGYIASGNLLKSVMIALKEWSLRMPDKERISTFVDKLDRGNFTDSSFTALLKGLSKNEKLEIILKLKKEHYPSKREIRKLGDPEDKLFFVVSGNLRENRYEAMDSKSKRYTPPVKNIRENDCFGEVYPLNNISKSKSIVETMTQSQLAVLSKEDLRRLSLKYPAIEKAVIRILRVRQHPEPPNAVLIRRHYRYPINVKITLKILDSNTPFNGRLFSGYSKDVSMGGVGFFADNIDKEAKDALSSLLENNKVIRVIIALQNECISVRTSGTIVRIQESIENGLKTVILGIEFDEMAPNLQGLLFYVAKTLAMHSEKESNSLYEIL
jgi:CRP-like cAMP-binding protein